MPGMYEIIVLLHLLKSIHNMFYRTTYNGITRTARVKQINVIYKEHAIRNMQKKYKGVICTQRHHTMKILYRYINSSLCYNIIIKLISSTQCFLFLLVNSNFAL